MSPHLSQMIIRGVTIKTGIVWFRLDSSRRFLWTLWLTIGAHERVGILWLPSSKIILRCGLNCKCSLFQTFRAIFSLNKWSTTIQVIFSLCNYLTSPFQIALWMSASSLLKHVTLVYIDRIYIVVLKAGLRGSAASIKIVRRPVAKVTRGTELQRNISLWVEYNKYVLCDVRRWHCLSNYS
jgi:hypothetical protein